MWWIDPEKTTHEQVRKVDGRTALAKRKRATRLTLHILAAVAEHEREMIAERTKAALQAAKARGIRLGRNGADRLAPAHRAEAIERARQLARGIPTPTGARWHAQTVIRMSWLSRAGVKFPFSVDA